MGATTLKITATAGAVMVVLVAAQVRAQAPSDSAFALPPEVTPALRAACEDDVRRLCIGATPTVPKVKACIAAKYFQLGATCRREITSAGLSLSMLR
jgi:hypothetical protein